MSRRPDFSFDEQIFRPGILRLLREAPPIEGERVLDLAAGSGMAARLAGTMVGATGRVTALDLGRNIMKKARDLYDAPAPVGFVRGDAMALPFADGAFDLVFCHQGLQFLDDPQRGLEEMRRVTARGGRVAVMTWGPLAECPIYAAVAEAMMGELGEGAQAFIQRPFSLPDGPNLAALGRAAGMGVRLEAASVPIEPPSAEAFALAFLSYIPSILTGGPIPGDRAQRIAREAGRILGRWPSQAGIMVGNIIVATHRRKS